MNRNSGRRYRMRETWSTVLPPVSWASRGEDHCQDACPEGRGNIGPCTHDQLKFWISRIGSHGVALSGRSLDCWGFCWGSLRRRRKSLRVNTCGGRAVVS